MVLSLLDTGAKITVIALKATQKIKSLAAKRVVLNLRDFVHDDLKGKLLIFAATNSDEVNKQVAHAARKKGIQINCVDDPEECDFFVPSFFRRGSFVVSISTGGKVPLYQKRLEGISSFLAEQYCGACKVTCKGAGHYLPKRFIKFSEEKRFDRKTN